MTMLEKLTRHYNQMLSMQPPEGRHGGYAVCFIRDDLDEVIMGKYEFPKGVFKIRSLTRDGIHWDYEPKKEAMT
ncbi:MAG: hypothetical protein WC517_04090 [Patescibacteria group bacterium]